MSIHAGGVSRRPGPVYWQLGQDKGSPLQLLAQLSSLSPWLTAGAVSQGTAVQEQLCRALEGIMDCTVYEQTCSASSRCERQKVALQAACKVWGVSAMCSWLANRSSSYDLVRLAQICIHAPSCLAWK